MNGLSLPHILVCASAAPRSVYSSYSFEIQGALASSRSGGYRKGGQLAEKGTKQAVITPIEIHKPV